MTAKKNTRKKRSSSSVEDDLNIRFPTDKECKDLIKTLKLSKAQAQFLMEVLGDIVVDIAMMEQLKKAQVKKIDAVRRVRNLELRFAQLIKAVQSEGKHLTEILPLSALEEVGNLFTFAAASAAMEKNLYPKDYLKHRETIEARGTLMTLQAIDQHYAALRRDIGLLHGADLLVHTLETVHLPLKSWIERNAQNPGGRPKQSIREFAIQRLIHFAPSILGSDPTPSVTGSFMTMAISSLSYCGFSDVGLEKAVAAELRKWKAFQEAGEEAKAPDVMTTHSRILKP